MEDTDESKPASPPLSFEGAKSLLDLLIKRGYLHDGDPIIADPRRGNPLGSETPEEAPILSPEDTACKVMVLEEEEKSDVSYCCTYPVLEKKLRKELESNGGRCVMKRLVASLRLHTDAPILRILEGIDINDIFQQGDELISSDYLDRATKDIFDGMLEEEEGKERGIALVADLASQKLHLPMDMTLQALQERLPNDGIQIIKLEAGSALVSEDYMKHYKAKVLERFAALKQPATISDICHAHHWDVGLVASWVQEGCQSEELSGTFHGGSNSTVGSMYTPNAHVEAQRQEVDELFAAQGYMTAARGTGLGLSKSTMGEYILDSFPSAIVVSETLVVIAETILSPLEVVIEEAIAMNSFVDLQEHMPADILEQEEDAKLILNNHVLPTLLKEDDNNTTSKSSKTKKKKAKSPSSLGVLVLSAASGGLFASDGMIKNFQKKMLPGLIADYAKERAKELDAAEIDGETSASASSKPTSSKKKGRKGKKGAKAASQEDQNQDHSEDVVPLIKVVQALGAEHPDLLEADLAMKEALESDGSDRSSLPQLQWETKADGSNDGGMGDASDLCNEGLICALCRSALYNEELVASCQRSIELELKTLQSARLSKASLSRKDAATKVRNVESAFEEAFIDACNLLQAQVKFLQYVEGCEDSKELVDRLTAELLQGCCADFTSRLTQYCLYKNEVDPTTFKFALGNDKDEAKEDGAQPIYCVSPDLAIRQYPATFLSLNATEDADGPSKAKDPLPQLREVLPGSIGVTLARQWVMCGGTCYQGGTKVDESGNEFSRPGDLEKFLSHVEENCLSVCGLPFKKLDKKSEKQFLFARRQRLLRMLEEAPKDDATTVLDLTIMLLFQQVKNVAAFGSSLYPDILKLLTLERKIDEEVANAMIQLSEAVKSAVDSALIETVRQCGLSRDISKHKLS